ncbi:MAG: hypothetical protein Fur0046_26930 [Cyanobacteria bacterium J069]|nr:MAG: hypothetical protein D6742_13965 [Cyanobacteria bacterium J069]
MAIALLSTACSQAPTSVRTVPIQQSWELQLGSTVGKHRIAGGLGDISIEMKGDRVYIPFDGEVQANNVAGCYIYSTPDVPAYIFRLCGLKSGKTGRVRSGDTLGTADYLHFAALRRQPEGTWALVEPSKEMLERMISK